MPRSPNARALPATWLVGKRTRLRPLEIDDVPLLGRFGLPLHTRGSIYIVQTLAGRDIGTLGFVLRGRSAAIGLNLESPRHWSDGSAADALRTMRLGVRKSQPIVRLEALVRSDRRSAVAAFAGAGFQREGLLRLALPVGKKFKDAVIMSAISDG